MGQRMRRLSDVKHTTGNGFVQTISKYKAQNCKACPLRCRCHRIRSERNLLLLAFVCLNYMALKAGDSYVVTYKLSVNLSFSQF